MNQHSYISDRANADSLSALGGTSLPFTLSQCVTILKARWRIGALAFVLVMAAALAAVLLSPVRYTASASVVVDMRLPDPVTGTILPAPPTTSYMSTQVNVVQSQRVAILAARMLKLDRNAQLREQWTSENTDSAAKFEDWLALRLQSYLDVEQGKDSNVLEITYVDADPERAAEVANAFVQAYLQVSTELRTEPASRYGELFDAQARRLRSDLDEARTRLANYERENGLVATANSIDLETRLLSDMSNQLLELQGKADESASRGEAAERNQDRMSEVLQSKVIDTLKAELATATASLSEMRGTLGARHPDIINQSRKVAELNRRLASETARIAGGASVESGIDRKRLEQLQKQVEAQRTKVLQLKNQRDKADGLLNDVDNAQKAYDAVVERTQMARLDSQTAQTNVAVLQTATVPLGPSHRRSILILMAALGLSGFLAISLPLLMELRDERLRGEEDAARRLGLPLLGILKDTSVEDAHERTALNRKGSDDDVGDSGSSVTPRLA